MTLNIKPTILNVRYFHCSLTGVIVGDALPKQTSDLNKVSSKLKNLLILLTACEKTRY